MIRVLGLTFLKIFNCNTLLQLFAISRTITATKTVIPFFFQGHLWGGFPSKKNFSRPFNTIILACFYTFLLFNPDLGGLFGGLLWGKDRGGQGGGRWVKITPPSPCLKLVKDMLETWNLARKYTFKCRFRKYNFCYQDSLDFVDGSFFLKKISVFWLK